jgi:LacI family transcriptional regulator
MGQRVPDDVAVAGIDDTELAELHLPSITGVSLESAAQGQPAGVAADGPAAITLSDR